MAALSLLVASVLAASAVTEPPLVDAESRPVETSTISTPEPPPSRPQLRRTHEAPPTDVPRARAVLALSLPSVFLGGLSLELEAAAAEQLSIYGSLEGYTFWQWQRPSWGAQVGARYYMHGSALNGAFLDVHARANDLRFLYRFLGGGLELGGQHPLGSSRLSLSWSVGMDFGVGRWMFFNGGEAVRDNGLLDGATGPFFLPKVRLMLGYRF